MSRPGAAFAGAAAALVWGALKPTSQLFNARGFVQATARHACFGAVLGRLA